MYSECLIVSRQKSTEVKRPAGLVSGWETSKYTTCCQKHGTKNCFNAQKCKLSMVQFLLACSLLNYRIYSNKRRGAFLIFRATSVALIRGRRLFKHCTRQIYFFYIFIQRYTFYLLIFLLTDTKLIVNLELQEKFTR